MALFFAV